MTRTVMVPEDRSMAEEPARTIGEMFADKKMVKTGVVAVVGLISVAFKVVVDDATIDNLVTVISGGSFIVAALMAQWEARKRAENQALATREAVYSPETVARIARDSQVQVDRGPASSAVV